MKKVFKYTLISLTVFITLTVGALFLVVTIAAQDPGVRMLLLQSGILSPSRVLHEEVSISVGDITVPVKRYYTRPVSDRCYVFIHGLTPLGYEHPALNDLAKALVDSTGMQVFIPDFRKYVKKDQKMKIVFAGVSEIYLKLQDTYKGKYRCFGSCIGGSILMNSMLQVPRERLPEKIFLYGPYNRGKGLLPFLQGKNKERELDFLVRLTLSSKSEYFSDQEKELVEKAMLASRPGLTDKGKMKQILGDELFKNISVFKFTENDMKDMDVQQQSISKHLATTRFYIIHSKNDRLIPFQQGKKLSEILKVEGLNVSFVGTEIFSHSKNKITVSGLYIEARYLVNFFNELFEGDVNR